MKADARYNHFVGTAAADISIWFAGEFGEGLEGLGRYFKLDLKRFEVIEVSISRTPLGKFYISLICIDHVKSTSYKKHITSIAMDTSDKADILAYLFERINIVLHARSDHRYTDLECDEVARYDAYH